MGGGGLVLVVGMPPPPAPAGLGEELLEKGLEKLNRLLDDDETVDAGLFWFLAWICLTVTPPPTFFVLLADELPSDFLRLNFIVMLLLVLISKVVDNCRLCMVKPKSRMMEESSACEPLPCRAL